MSDDAEMEVEKKKKKKDKKRLTQSITDDTAAPTTTAPATTDDDTEADTAAADGRKLCKKLLKLVKKASKTKNIRRGVKEVVKAIRKGEKGVMVIAGNITPIDVITHLPVLCEENEIPYIYVPLKEELGSAGATKRPTSCVLVESKKGSEHEDYYEEVRNEVLKVSPLIS